MKVRRKAICRSCLSYSLVRCTGLQQLVLLNSIVQVQDTAETIAKQRLIFFVKHVIPWLHQQDPPLSLPVQAEVCRVLGVMLPYMNDIYGSHWSDVLSYLTELWSGTKSLEINQDCLLPVLHASLKLLDVLRRLKSKEDANDDLQDGWKEAEGAIARGLINLLKQARDVSDEHHQPMMIFNELLARQISHLPLKHIDDPSEVSHLASQLHDIGCMIFSLLCAPAKCTTALLTAVR